MNIMIFLVSYDDGILAPGAKGAGKLNLDGNLSPMAKKLLNEERTNVIKTDLSNMQAQEPHMLCEIMKHIMTELKSSPVFGFGHY